MKTKKPVKAWAVYSNGILAPYGNGNQFYYPIFFTKREAKEFIIEIIGFESSLSVQKVLISLIK